jgi:diphosphomevalonate decarboxylase
MSDQYRAAARACANIAFIKYWGNADDTLRLPVNSSISMNLAGLFAETTVEWDANLSSDEFVFGGAPQTGEPLARVSRHLDLLRQRWGKAIHARVESANNFPTGAGIASSAAAFAALSVAGAAAAKLELSEQELTTLARRGSGSASRSVPSGFVEWHAGTSHETSYAETAFQKDYWNIVDIIAVVSREHKKTGSSLGHRSADTSDLQKARVAGARNRLDTCKQAIQDRDFQLFADVVEADSNLMHAVMMTSRPPLFYWLPQTLALMEIVREMREEKGLRVCYTLDAGPNVHCICVSDDADRVREHLEQTSIPLELLTAVPGEKAEIVGQ